MDKSKAKAKPKQGDSTGKASAGKKQDKNLGQKSSKASSASPASPSNQKKMKSKNSKSSCASSKSKQQRGNKATSSAESSSKRSKATTSNSSSGGNIKSSANKSQEQTKKSNIKPTSKQTKSSDASKKVSPSSHHHQKNTNKNQKQTNTPKSTKTKNQRALKSKENKSEKSSSETVEGTGSSEFNSAREITHSDSTKTQDFCSASSGAKSQEAKTLKMKSAPPRSTCKTTKTMKQKIKSKIVKPGSMMAKSSNVEESEHATDQTEDESSSQAIESPVEGKTTTGEDGYQYKWVPDDGSPEGSNNDDDSSDQSASSDENIESTKPTINQKTKAKKERPLNDSDTISKIEFESLNDEINELNSGIQMLKHSYGGIIKSLMVMQKRRMKKKLAKQKSADEEVKLSFLTTLSTVDPKVLMKTNCVTSSDKYTMERFVNPLTREDTFQELFDEVDDLNQQTDKLRSCYDKRGNFLRDKFEDLDISIDRKQFNELKTWVKKLCSIVDEIARNYNDDLLNMFRLN